MISPDNHHTATGLRHYLDVLRRRKWIVVAAAVVSVASAAAVSYSRTPLYEAEAKVVVGQGNSLFEPGEANAVEPFTATMRELVESDLVAIAVIDSLELDRSPEALQKAVDASFSPETAVLNVRVQDPDPELAAEIASTIGEEFSRLVDERFGRVAVDAEGSQLPLTVTVWDSGRTNPTQVAPRPIRAMSIALVLGLGLGLLAAFLRDFFDRTLRSREDVEVGFGAPVIGQVPFVRRSRGLVREFWGTFPQGEEAFRALRANLQFLGVQGPLRTILVTSAGPAQGKTTLVSNLAVAIAQSGAPPVIIEADLRRPRLAEVFGFPPNRPGLTSVLVGGVELGDALVQIPVRGADGATLDTRVSVLPSGPLPPNPSELLSSVPMELLLDRLTDRFDYVLIDSPPMLAVADTLGLARLVDGVVFAVRRNRTTIDEARELRALTERLEIHVLGAVLTDATPTASYTGTYGQQAEPGTRTATTEVGASRGY